VAKTALVLAETVSGRARDIAYLFRYVDGVKTVHLVSESYGVIALMEAGNSDGIRDIASRIALASGVTRCVVCSEHVATAPEGTNGFAGIPKDDYSYWCVREPDSRNLCPL
jgi:hypothetical protein